jgi:hypothetical protein
MMYLFCREAVGTGGEQAEISHYGGIAYGGPARFASAYKVMFGRDISPYNDITMVLPRKVFMTYYGANGQDRAQEINSEPEIWPDGWGGHFSSAFYSVPEQYKPAVLWAWNRASGVTPAKDGTAIKGDPVMTFLFYPLDMTPRAPKEVMPLTWEAPDFGFYGFRNSWEGTDDIICTAWLRAHTIGGWNGPNAGTFRLFGFGQTWAWGPHDRNRMRWEENVVQLPDNPEINAGALGRLTYLKTEPDGSGSLSMDLNDVYAGATEPKKPQYARYGNFRYAPGFTDTGISGMRAMAVDYSGLSGAPCLLVLVDRITGGKNKVWTWNLERGDGKKIPGDIGNTKVDAKSFTIAKGGASLKGTFVSPAELRLTAETKQLSMKGGAGSSAGKDLPKPIPGVFAESQDGRFFCIVTLQRGPAPEVQVAGEGLDAVVTVGKRMVKFDGARIIFGVK